MRHIRQAQFTTMPWRNGGGVTHEIARDGAGDAFGWRISVAEVAASGPFSLFPRHRRLLCVIDGAGMALVSASATLLAKQLEPVAFEGREAIDGRLLDGPCRDFNLIYDAGLWQGSMTVLRSAQVLTPAATITGLFLMAGGAQSGAGDIPAGDFVLLDEPSDELRLRDESLAIAIELERQEDAVLPA